MDRIRTKTWDSIVKKLDLWHFKNYINVIPKTLTDLVMATLKTLSFFTQNLQNRYGTSREKNILKKTLKNYFLK